MWELIFKNCRPLNPHFYMAHLLLAIKMTVFFPMDGKNKNEIKKEEETVS